MNYVYGMRLRGCAPGCQPKQGMLDWRDTTPATGYYSFLLYSRKLTADECKSYDLDYLHEHSGDHFTA